MDTRKLIKFGKNSYVVSLPKNWVTANKLEKGANLFLEQRSGELLISPTNVVKEEKRAYISCDGKTQEELQTELFAYYKANYSLFIFEGKELQRVVIFLKRLLSNLSGVEIVELQLNRLIAQDMLDVRQILLSTLINRMDMMIRSMFQDVLSKEYIDSKVIDQRDQDVNRIQLLVARTVRGVFENPALGNLLSVTPLKAFYLSRVAWVLERVGDYIKRTNRQLPNVPKRYQEIVRDFLKRAYTKYLASIKAFNKRSAELAVKTHKEIIFELTCLNKKDEAYNNKSFLLVLENAKNIFRDMRVLLRSTIEYPDVFFNEKHKN